MAKTVFVTTGATATFEQLIELVLEPLFISELQKLGYTTLVLQYGISSNGEELFLKSLAKFPKVKNSGKWTVEMGGITVEGFAFAADVKKVVNGSNLVISHAGTGSILDALRLGKKLIVVINSRLMDDHQAEVAGELAQGSHLIKCMPNLDQLISCLNEVETTSFKPLPVPNGNIFQKILEEA